MKKNLAILLIILLFFGCRENDTKKNEINTYKPTWTSLQKHDTPQWLKDAKFGIYTHFSLETFQNEGQFKHEVIDDFKFENFDAQAWAKLFQRAGAKFAGPVAWHGSGMVHWDSDITELDVVDRGPHKDLTGLLKREITNLNMKFLMSFHTGFWYGGILDRENPGRKDPNFFELYGTPHDEEATDIVPWVNHIEKQSKYSEEYANLWLAKMKEAVTKYSPDISWLDVSFGGSLRPRNIKTFLHGKLVDSTAYFPGFDEGRQLDYISHFFNMTHTNGQEVEIVYKEHDIPPGIGMRNFENGLIDELTYDTWMTDIDICQPVSWFYKDGITIKDANLIVDILVDVTAKNGVLLLNVPPKPDGTFADFIAKELYGVGDWLYINGEAIYGTMPWSIYGEGPSFLTVTGHYSEKEANATYTEKDFRFTQKDNVLYAICLGVPKGEVTIFSLGTNKRLYPKDIISVELLGSSKKIEYTQTKESLKLKMPSDFKGKYASVFKINRKL